MLCAAAAHVRTKIAGIASDETKKENLRIYFEAPREAMVLG